MKKTVTGLLLSVLCGAWFAPPGAAQPLAFQDSPFGLQAPFCLPPLCKSQSPGYSNSKVLGYLSEVDVKWVRLVEPELDEVRYLLSENSINILVGLGVMGEEAIRVSVGKYKDQVKHWLLVDEADGTWKGTPEEYVKYFISASSAIKDKCPDCKVILSLAGGQVIGGELTGKGPVFFELALKNGVGPHFDVLDYHAQGAAGEYKDLIIKVNVYKTILEKYGIKNTPIWITEYGTYDGDPTPGDGDPTPDYPPQTENQQAAELVKKYIYGVSLGVDKMFWTTMEEWYNFGGNVNSYYSNVGLVNNPLNDGKSHKKLSYYTYKKMTELLEGADWNNIQTVQESGNVYVYKFNRNGAPVYVAWWDYFNDPAYAPGKTTPVTITGLTGNAALATDAVPQFSSGAGVTNYTTAFRQQTLAVTGGTVTLALGESPVFVEGPAVSLRVNGDSSATVTATNPVTVDYTLRGGAGQEFFLTLDAPAMNIPLSYRSAAGQWVPLPANLSSVTPYTAAPADGDYTLYTGPVPAGAYSLCLGYDTVSNGHLDLAAAVYDCVAATVR